MNTTAMIAFLPTNGSWCKQDFPHLTLVFAGEIEGRSISEFNSLGKDAISAARAVGTFSLSVTGVEQLGDEGEEVDALIFYPTPQLLVARKMVESWNQSEHTDFLPHATIGPAGSAYATSVPGNTDDYSYHERRAQTLPSSVYFDRIAACWGDDKMIFGLGSYDY